MESSSGRIENETGFQPTRIRSKELIMKNTVLMILAVAAVLAAAGAAQAAITEIGLWRMGEGDGSVGGSVSTVSDATGNGHTLTVGTPANATYSSVVAPGATMMSVNFGGGSGGASADVGINTITGVGFEGWYRPTLNPDFGSYGDYIMYYGANNANGFGIGLHHRQGITSPNAGFRCVLGGKSDHQITTPLVAYDEWQHVAVVRDGSTVRFYINGIQVDTNTTVPNMPGTTFYVMGNNQSAILDQVRFFTFEGTFDPADLNYPSIQDIPEPATMSLLALGGLCVLIRRRKSRA
jgi:hypothetical protein